MNNNNANRYYFGVESDMGGESGHGGEQLQQNMRCNDIHRFSDGMVAACRLEDKHVGNHRNGTYNWTQNVWASNVPKMCAAKKNYQGREELCVQNENHSGVHSSPRIAWSNDRCGKKFPGSGTTVSSIPCVKNAGHKGPHSDGVMVWSLNQNCGYEWNGMTCTLDENHAGGHQGGALKFPNVPEQPADHNTMLKFIRTELGRMKYESGAQQDPLKFRDTAMLMLQYFESLDAQLSNGAQLPDDWAKRKEELFPEEFDTDTPDPNRKKKIRKRAKKSHPLPEDIVGPTEPSGKMHVVSFHEMEHTTEPYWATCLCDWKVSARNITYCEERAREHTASLLHTSTITKVAESSDGRMSWIARCNTCGWELEELQLGQLTKIAEQHHEIYTDSKHPYNEFITSK